MRKALEAGLVCALIVAVLYVEWVARGRLEIGGQDEGSMLLYPIRVLAGDVPHRDFATLYGPGQSYVTALVFAVTGPSLTVLRLLGLLTRGALLGGLYAVGRRRGRSVAATALALGAVITGPLMFVFVGFLIANALLVWAVALLGRSRRATVAAGVLLGLTTFFRVDFAVPAAAIALAVLLVDGRSVVPLLSGGAAGAVPLAVHVVIAGPGAVLRNVIGYTADSAAGRRLPVPPTDGPLRLLFFAVLVAVAIAVATAIRRRDPFTAAASAAAVALAYYTLGRADGWHLLGFAMVAAPLSVVATATVWRPAITAPALGALVLVATSATTVQPSLETARLARRGGIIGTEFEHQGRTLVVASGSEVRLTALLAAIDQHSKPGDRLIVGADHLAIAPYSDSFLYVLTPRLTPGTYFLEMNPNTSNRPGSGFARDVDRADLVVLTKVAAAFQSEPNEALRPLDPRPDRILARCFRKVYSDERYDLHVRSKC